MQKLFASWKRVTSGETKPFNLTLAWRKYVNKQVVKSYKVELIIRVERIAARFVS